MAHLGSCSPWENRDPQHIPTLDPLHPPPTHTHRGFHFRSSQRRMSILYNKSSEQQEPKVAREGAGQRMHEVQRGKAGKSAQCEHWAKKRRNERERKEIGAGKEEGREGERWEGNLLRLKRDVKDIPTNVQS